MPNRFSISILVAAIAGCAGDDPELASTTSNVNLNAFVLPMLSASDRAEIVQRYAQLDPTGVVPRGMLEDAIVYFDVNKALIPKQDYFIVINLAPYSGKDRFWMVDLASGAVESHKVAHGDGSDPDNDGYATLFSNVDGSHQSSLGFYLTAEIYDGTHPHSMAIDGLSPDGSPNGMADTNVRERAIIVHEASYVSDSNSSQQGRSNGCFALDPAIELGVVNRIHDGTLMYAAISPLNPPVGAGDCGTIGAAGGTIDNGDRCFTAGGPATGLHAASGGMGSSLVWTRTTALSYEQNYAEWQLSFAEAGRYRVEVYTAAAYAQSKQARYVIHAGGSDHAVTLDQTAADGYQSLGELDFAAGPGQSIHLGDNTGETTKPQLVFDAVRLTRVGSGGGGAADSPGDGSDSDGGGATGGGCSTSGGGGSGGGVTGGLLGLALLVRRRRRNSPLQGPVFRAAISGGPRP